MAGSKRLKPKSVIHDARSDHVAAALRLAIRRAMQEAIRLTGKKTTHEGAGRSEQPLAQHAVEPASAPIAQAPKSTGAYRLPSFAVGLSGGPDSAMLAVHAAAVARDLGVGLHIFHVHHGLQAPADRWRNQVHDLAMRLRLPCHSVQVHVHLDRGDGMEEAARHARYTALARLARQHDVHAILLAHHRDDQAETVLLRLLRGAGPAGLGAMAPRLERDGVVYLRPWLDIARAEILEQAQRYKEETGWKPVQDPTNTDDQYTRAAVRERLAPQLNVRWPGWQANLARHARLSREAALVLDEIAEQDLRTLEPSDDLHDFSLLRWRQLSRPRQALVLRRWLACLNQRMPTEARLEDLMRQLRGLHALGHDRQMRVKHGDAHIVCRRGRVALERAALTDDEVKKS